MHQFVKLFSLLFILTVLSIRVDAQAREDATVTVVLKNGKIMQGVIIDSIYEGFLTLEIDEVTHMEITYNKIDRIYFGTYEAEQKSSLQKEAYIPSDHTGWNHVAGTGLVAGQGNRLGSAFSLHLINNYQFESGWQLGLGTDLQLFNQMTSLPLYLKLYKDFTKKQVTPFAFVDTGYGFAWMNGQDDWRNVDRVKGSMLIQPGLGYRFNLRSTSILFSVGYHIQKVTMYYSEIWWDTQRDVQEEITLRRAAFKLSISI